MAFRGNFFVSAALAGAVAGAFALSLFGCAERKADDSVRVGILHSLTGTMAISETAVRDAELLAVGEINAAGGVLGKKIVAVEEDGASDPLTFADKARKLLCGDKVATVFGCWTSAARKAVKPVFEEQFGLLWYPVQYEGMEASPNIMYMGASPNQQIVPAVEYCAENLGRRMFIVGSDYVFPRTASRIIRAQLADIGGECVGEEYVPLGSRDFSAVADKIVAAGPDVVLNTLNGDSNVAFFAELSRRGITGGSLPVMSFSISEEEVARMDSAALEGNLVSWSYYETTQTERNRQFVAAYKEAYGGGRMACDPVEAGYVSVYMWAAACEKAGSFDVEAVRVAAKGLSFSAPEGIVTIDGGNQHLSRHVRIGRIGAGGVIEEVWATPAAVKPDPYLSTYPWARGL